jgi:mycothiol S-conjugate amidase
MCHKISVAAFDAAGDPDRYPDAGEPWQPLKLYYHMGHSRPRFVALHEWFIAAGLESPYGEWLEHWDPEHDKGHRVTTRVECADWFEVRDDALRAHATQVDPEGFWFRVPLDVQRKVWPTEDFELVRSVVPAQVADGEVEDDLFAGVREQVCC